MAYTGCRINEAVHLEWKDIDVQQGVAWLYFKTENDLKTEGSQAPFGLPDKLIDVLCQWQTDKTCTWVFPNTRKQPEERRPGPSPIRPAASPRKKDWRRQRQLEAIPSFACNTWQGPLSDDNGTSPGPAAAHEC